MSERFLITGGAGFIGSALVRHLLNETTGLVFVVDKLTYAANLDALAAVAGNARYAFLKSDIADLERMQSAFESFRPTVVIHLAAESHVDRSIDGPGEFIQTNVIGTFTLLQAALGYWRKLPDDSKSKFRFHHVSTDEVFGSLDAEGAFDEMTRYCPNSPYSASKAASDHLVAAWHHTYGLPTVITNCTNNYGPWQFPEKLIPLMIINAVEGRPLPVYGDGRNVRDWLYVDDHVNALLAVAIKGRVGETYCIGGLSERSNLDVSLAICRLVDEFAPKEFAHESLIRFVPDRPGHDLRYAISPAKIMAELNWRPEETFDSGLRKTFAWYCGNRQWWERLRQHVYGGQRLGVVT